MSQLQEQAQALQEQSVQRTREDAAKLGALEATLVALYERKGTQVQEGANSTDGVSVSGHGSPYAASIAELDAESAVLSEDLQSFAEKYHRLCQALELKPSFPTGETLTPTIPFINSEPEVLRETFTALATSEMQLAQTKKALQSLDDGTLRGHTHVMNSDNSVCITCGQPLDEDACMARREHLQGDQSRLANLVRSNKQRYGSLKELDMVIDVLNKGVAKLASLNEERVAAEVGLAKDKEEKLALEHAITSAKADIKVFNEQHALYDLQYREEYKNIMLKIADLTEKKNIVEAAINQQFEASSALQRVRAEHRAQLERAKERAEEAERMADKASDNLQNARVSVSRLRSQLSTSQREVALSDRLSTLFGTRGIQNYVFSETLQQLETLTNVFLIALSDGELQLALQSAGGEEKGEGGSDSLWATDLTGSDSRREGDNEENKIVRFALLRDDTTAKLGADRLLETNADVLSLYKRRSLSQLSGGQWQRVQLSLDLAFAECVRRRGLLRSNLIVMDEVLTHLDTSGREAVGGLLRCMVRQGAPRVII